MGSIPCRSLRFPKPQQAVQETTSCRAGFRFDIALICWDFPVLCPSWPRVPRTAVDAVAERGMGEGTRRLHGSPRLLAPGRSARPASTAVWGARDTRAPRCPPPRLRGPCSKGADEATQVVPRPLRERPAILKSLWRLANTLEEATHLLLSIKKIGTVT